MDIAGMSRTLFHLMLLLAALTSAMRPARLAICVEADGLVRVEAAGEACTTERSCADGSSASTAYHESHGCDDYAVLDAGLARPDEASPPTLPVAFDHLMNSRPAAPPLRSAIIAGSRGALPTMFSPRGVVLRI